MNDSSHLIQTFIRPFTENLSGETQAQKFTTELNYKKIYLSGEYSGKFLSKREAQCLLLFSKGYTMREIAEHIHLSPRTVETYFKNVKDKLGCYTKSELLSAFSQIYSLHI